MKIGVIGGVTCNIYHQLRIRRCWGKWDADFELKLFPSRLTWGKRETSNGRPQERPYL